MQPAPACTSRSEPRGSERRTAGETADLAFSAHAPEILRLEGYAVDGATDGAHALAQLDALRADVVVLDILMPGLDGLTVCQRLRATGDRTPVLMLTARDLLADGVRASTRVPTAT